MRVTVYKVLDYLSSGMSYEELLADSPDLNLDNILACLAFASDWERRYVSVLLMRLLFLPTHDTTQMGHSNLKWPFPDGT